MSDPGPFRPSCFSYIPKKHVSGIRSSPLLDVLSFLFVYSCETKLLFYCSVERAVFRRDISQDNIPGLLLWGGERLGRQGTLSIVSGQGYW